jgi:hypothetical protein
MIVPRSGSSAPRRPWRASARARLCGIATPSPLGLEQVHMEHLRGPPPLAPTRRLEDEHAEAGDVGLLGQPLAVGLFWSHVASETRDGAVLVEQDVGGLDGAVARGVYARTCGTPSGCMCQSARRAEQQPHPRRPVQWPETIDRSQCARRTGLVIEEIWYRGDDRGGCHHWGSNRRWGDSPAWRGVVQGPEHAGRGWGGGGAADEVHVAVELMRPSPSRAPRGYTVPRLHRPTVPSSWNLLRHCSRQRQTISHAGPFQLQPSGERITLVVVWANGVCAYVTWHYLSRTQHQRRVKSLSSCPAWQQSFRGIMLCLWSPHNFKYPPHPLLSRLTAVASSAKRRLNLLLGRGSWFVQLLSRVV